MAMYCTNCGEEMRDIDKFCASCGTAAAPRKTRAAAPAPQEPPASPRPSRSTAEAFHAPLPATSTNAGNVNRPAPPAKTTPAAPPPLSRQQEQQVLLEAEEIASVRDMLPIDALPQFPPAAPAVETLRCGSCGETNPAGNEFCERCGRPLQAGAAVQSAPAPAPVAQSTWLDVPEPTRKPATAPAKSAAAAKRATALATTATVAKGKDEDFFYFYDDSSRQGGKRKVLIALAVVLALGVLGVIYLLSRPSAKTAAGANVTITIAPTEAQIAPGGTQDFSATVTGSGNTDVTWSVTEGGAGGNVVSHGAQAQGGTVASLGVYSAPATGGTYHVVATSKADPTKAATAEVLVSGK